jgi:type VII secretion-associated serine protease mycosin
LAADRTWRAAFALLAAALPAAVTLAAPAAVSLAAPAAVSLAAPAAISAPSPCQQAPSPGAPIPPLAPRDPLITRLGLDQTWALSTGAGITVGVVDTGVDPASPKLTGAVQLGATFRVTDDARGYTSAPDGRVDCDGHGTEVAGLIAGRTSAGDDRVSGIAPGAAIYPVAIQGDIGQAPAALIAAAIRDAAAHANVLNLSFAQSTDSPAIAAAIRYAQARDVVVVAAAANETGTAASGGAATWYPAAYPGVLAVTSIGASGQPTGNGARGDWISLAAPGEQLTTESRGGHGFVTVSGTSFATAVVSGTAALLRARFPSMPAAQVVARLERTAVPPGNGSRNDTVGYGTVNPFAALTATDVPAAGTQPHPAGTVPVLAAHVAGGASSSGPALAGTLALLAGALLVGLGTLSVRGGRRRGWRAGALPAAPGDGRVAAPHGAELD